MIKGCGFCVLFQGVMWCYFLFELVSNYLVVSIFCSVLVMFFLIILLIFLGFLLIFIFVVFLLLLSNGVEWIDIYEDVFVDLCKKVFGEFMLKEYSLFWIVIEFCVFFMEQYVFDIF